MQVQLSALSSQNDGKVAENSTLCILRRYFRVFAGKRFEYRKHILTLQFSLFIHTPLVRKQKLTRKTVPYNYFGSFCQTESISVPSRKKINPVRIWTGTHGKGGKRKTDNTTSEECTNQWGTHIIIDVVFMVCAPERPKTLAELLHALLVRWHA